MSSRGERHVSMCYDCYRLQLKERKGELFGAPYCRVFTSVCKQCLLPYPDFVCYTEEWEDMCYDCYRLQLKDYYRIPSDVEMVYHRLFDQIKN